MKSLLKFEASKLNRSSKRDIPDWLYCLSQHAIKKCTFATDPIRFRFTCHLTNKGHNLKLWLGGGGDEKQVSC